MWESLLLYLIDLFNDVPLFIYWGLLIVFCLAVVFVLIIFDKDKRIKTLGRILLVEYVFLILCSTVFFRQYNESQIHENVFGMSFPSIIEGRIDVIAEKVLNIIAFVPVGLLLKSVYRRINCWQVLLIGFVISITIEALQFFYNKGYSEFSDVINNVLGCVVGFYLYKAILFIFIHVFSKKNSIIQKLIVIV